MAAGRKTIYAFFFVICRNIRGYYDVFYIILGLIYKWIMGAILDAYLGK